MTEVTNNLVICGGLIPVISEVYLKRQANLKQKETESVAEFINRVNALSEDQDVGQQFKLTKLQYRCKPELVTLMSLGKWPETVEEAEVRLRSVEANSNYLEKCEKKETEDKIMSELKPKIDMMFQQISAVHSNTIKQLTTSPTMVEPLLYPDADRKAQVEQRTRTPRRQRRRNPCHRCGECDHIPSQCRFIRIKCNKCKSIGHKAKMCRSKPKHFSAQPSKFISATGLNNTKASNLIKIRVANHSGMAMVDSGATISAISADFYYANLHKKVTLEKASLLATGASGASLRGIGTIEVPIEIGRLTMQQTFHIFENFTHSIILGLDFLDNQKARLNFDDKTLVLQSGITEVPLTNGDNNDNSICFISLVNDEVIPSRSEVIIPVQTVDKSIKSKLGIIEPNPALIGKQNIVGATCLVQIRNNKTFLQVLNPTNAKVRLSKHTKIGKFSDIIENSISSEITDDTVEINSIDKGTQNKNNEAKYIEIAKSLNFNFSDSDLTTEQKQKLMVMLGTNRDVFAMNLSELGCTDLHPHRIETGDAQPVRQRFYRQSPAVKGEASKHVEEMLKYDIIEPSQSEWASPICLVQKKSPKSASSTPNTPQLLVKGAKFIWDNDCQNAFEEIKKLLISSPILAFPDFSKDFILYTDASQIAIGYILGQKDHKGREQVIAYGGRSLRGAEKNYCIRDLEYLALVEGVKQYHVYLASRKFTIYTDHEALLHTQKLTKEKITGRLARWAMFLQSYDYEIIYKKGTANGNADALSRRPYDTEIATITTATVESSTQTEASFIELDPYASICEITTSPKEKVVNDQRTDENFKDVIKYILDKELPDKTRQARKTVIESQDYIIDDDVLYHLYYPKGKGHRADRIVKRLAVPLTLRDDILKSYHDSLLGGHGGIERTYHTIRYKYYWPGMYSDIQQYVQTCIQCQRAKPDAHKRPTPLQPLPILDVFRRVHMDILGPFRKSPDGYSHVLLVVDSFSKYVEIFPMKNTGAKDVANIFYNQWICRYSAPDAILTDKGQNFMSNILKEVCNIFEIKKMRTSSYRPQTNSTCERNNKTIAEKLRTYIAANQLDWPDKLSSIAHAMNTSVCTESTRYTPYYMVFSRECRTPIDTVLTAPTNVGPDARLFIDGLHSNVLLAREIAKENSLEEQQKYKARHD
ncbi:unnamed protein product [Mytilus edulis]|uniref:Integrase catalytic domain-containing protein n=1 Tax=Mytilus edulis TaxID=6550 RepID=A0A8S3VEF0_MYTED|nr:unnamed protein product [Mytilus edulis]